MSIHEANEEYRSALRQGQKQYKELVAAGRDPHPAVLDDILPDGFADLSRDIGLVEIPIDRIVGTTAAGRITAFTASFQPLLPAGSEFGSKWIRLCAAHLSEEGIRDPIVCYEYLGNFYVQEGNKRVSVLRHFGAPRIPGMVRRIIPPLSDDPQIIAYYEFMEFYDASRLYTVLFRRPGDYAKLLGYLGKAPGEAWTDREKKTFSAYFQYFREAFDARNSRDSDIRPEEALLLWLSLYPYQDLGRLSASELRKTLVGLWDDVISATKPEAVTVQTTPMPPVKPGFLGAIFSTAPSHVNVAFVQSRDPDTSAWTLAHEEGRRHLELVIPNHVTTRSYFHADTPEAAEQLMEHAVEDGADVVFTTTPQLSRATLKAAVRHPDVHFLNCSVNIPYSSVRSYYSRIYEAKFITGAIAGAMVKNDRIGYVADYPIFGVPASINAFALGAQLTNPNAKIHLRWSCQHVAAMEDFLREGIRVISNRDVPTPRASYMEHGAYGTYLMNDDGSLLPLSSPVWLWGQFYEHVIRAILDGAWEDLNRNSGAVNFWWGMDSGVIDVKLTKNIPDGVRSLAKILRRGMISGSIDPFFRRISGQDGSVKNDGTHTFHPDELLQMDWLCSNVIGSIPQFDEILPFAQQTVRELGVYRDRIPVEKEGNM